MFYVCYYVYVNRTVVLIILFVKRSYTRMQLKLEERLNFTKTVLEAEALRNRFVIYRFLLVLHC